jgi:serine/threonine protein kinase
MLTGGRSVMLSRFFLFDLFSELQKDSKFFDKLKMEIVKERNHDIKIYELMENLLNFDPKKRPNTFEVLKEIREMFKFVRNFILTKNTKIELIDIISTGELKQMNDKLDEKLLIYILNFLEVSDLYNVMRTSKKYNKICQNETLWKMICENELGEMTKINLKVLNKKQVVKEENESWKKYMIRYYDFQGRAMVILSNKFNFLGSSKETNVGENHSLGDYAKQSKF